MSDTLMLTGNLPVETPEEAFTVFGKPLGPYLPAMPDGEAGYRNFWVQRLWFQVFNGHPDIETLSRPVSKDGGEALATGVWKGAPPQNWKFRLKDGVNQLRFADPGSRLGFSYDAASSFSTFRLLREQGRLSKGLRFQVSMPMVHSTVNQTRFAAEDLVKIRQGYETALLAETRKIVEQIPHEDLAISWDASREISDVYEGVPGASPAEVVERSISQFRNIMPSIPEKVMVGVHLCFGTSTGWPRFSPPDLARTVDLANAIVAESGRRVDWIHIPILPKPEASFYAPLKNLKAPDSRIYLGMIHNMEGFKNRFEAARRVLPEFGLAGYCGFGAGRRTRAESQKIVDDHLLALDLAGMR